MLDDKIKHVVKYEKYMEVKHNQQLLDHHNIYYVPMEVVSTSRHTSSRDHEVKTLEDRHFEIRFYSDEDYHAFMLIKD
jgi:hypothetical protein